MAGIHERKLQRSEPVARQVSEQIIATYVHHFEDDSLRNRLRVMKDCVEQVVTLVTLLEQDLFGLFCRRL